MPGERVSMRKIREVLRLRFAQGLSQSAIGTSLGLSTGAVNSYLGRARMVGLDWPLADEFSDAELETLLYPPSPELAAERRPVPDWAVVHRELRRPNVTLALLWEEYRGGAGGQRLLNRAYHVCGSLGIAKMLQHHCAAPDLSDGIRQPFPRYIRCRAMNRLEEAGIPPFRIDVGGGCDSDGARACRAEIGKNVAKQVAGNHHVKPIGMLHEICGQNIDVKFVYLYVRICLRHQCHALIPVRHSDRDSV